MKLKLKDSSKVDYVLVNNTLITKEGVEINWSHSFVNRLLSDNNMFEIKENSITLVESAAGIFFVGLGLYGLITRGAFLENFMATGKVGQLFSAGIIPLIYIAIAFKVGAELTNILKNLIEA